MSRLIYVLAAFAGCIVLCIVLEVFLSKRESRWPGLRCAVAVAAAVPLGNLPTLLLLAVYFSVREKRRKRRDVERTNIQDL